MAAPHLSALPSAGTRMPNLSCVVAAYSSFWQSLR